MSLSKRPMNLADGPGGSAKRKHVSLSIKEKIELLQKLDKGVSVSKLCCEYSVGKSTVYDLKKQRKELFAFFFRKQKLR